MIAANTIMTDTLWLTHSGRRWCVVVGGGRRGGLRSVLLVGVASRVRERAVIKALGRQRHSWQHMGTARSSLKDPAGNYSGRFYLIFLVTM